LLVRYSRLKHNPFERILIPRALAGLSLPV